MIPTVEERQLRPCMTCVFLRYPVKMEGWVNHKAKCAIHQFVTRDGGSCGRYRWKENSEILQMPVMACKYHYTCEEMKELIDSGAIP